jgi:hypothetical protein
MLLGLLASLLSTLGVGRRLGRDIFDHVFLCLKLSSIDKATGSFDVVYTMSSWNAKKTLCLVSLFLNTRRVMVLLHGIACRDLMNVPTPQAARNSSSEIRKRICRESACHNTTQSPECIRSFISCPGTHCAIYAFMVDEVSSEKVSFRVPTWTRVS